MTEDTITVGRAQAAVLTQQDRVPVEGAVAAAFRAFRKDAARAAEANTDDFLEEWSTQVLDARPLIVVGAVMHGDARLWLMQPGAANDLVFSAQVHELGAENEIGWAEAVVKTKLFTTVCDDVGWLVKEATLSFPDGQ